VFLSQLQVELRSLATLGGVWKQGGVYVTRNNTDISYCILFQKNKSTIELISAGDNSSARSVTIDTITKLIATDFPNIHFSLKLSLENDSAVMVWKDEKIRTCLRDKGYLEYFTIEGKSVTVNLHNFAKLIDSNYQSMAASLPSANDVDVEDGWSSPAIRNLAKLVSFHASDVHANRSVNAGTEFDTVDIDIALEDAVPDILRMMGIHDAGTVLTLASNRSRSRQQICVLFLPRVVPDTSGGGKGTVSLHPRI
jgi:hypothetical protein